MQCICQNVWIGIYIYIIDYIEYRMCVPFMSVLPKLDYTWMRDPPIVQMKIWSDD